MASIMQILRRIGGAKTPPTSGSAGQLALWKAGTAPTDAASLYVHDGTQWKEVIDTAGQWTVSGADVVRAAGNAQVAGTVKMGSSFQRNKIINGDLSISQRGVTIATTAVGQYGPDRWLKVDANNMTQWIESGNFEPNTVHTLSWAGGTPTQLTSPASGHWKLPNIPVPSSGSVIKNIQLEEGNIATPFERRSMAIELLLCQRYYCTFSVGAGSCYGAAGAGATARAPFFFPVPMRVAPTLVLGTLASNNITSDNFTSFIHTPGGGIYEVVQGTNAGNFSATRAYCTADAEIR